jgi:hypothetical protein
VRVDTYYMPNRLVYERTIASARSRLDAQWFDAVWAEGRAMTLTKHPELVFRAVLDNDGSREVCFERETVG